MNRLPPDFKSGALTTRPRYCYFKCAEEVTCQSYNFVIYQSVCELNNQTKEARPEDFMRDQTRFYMKRGINRGTPQFFLFFLLVLNAKVAILETRYSTETRISRKPMQNIQIAVLKDLKMNSRITSGIGKTDRSLGLISQNKPASMPRSVRTNQKTYHLRCSFDIHS